MPDRYLREALLRSERWHATQSEHAQLLFVRLLLVVDDFGCFDGRDVVIANVCYPVAAAPHDEVAEFVSDLHRAGLIVRYSNRAKPFIAIDQWGNNLRYHRRFPAPPVDVDIRDLKYRGKYGKPIEWRNPEGFDDVSILLDLQGRPVVPQPPEWRRPKDWSPLHVLHDVRQSLKDTVSHTVSRSASVTDDTVSAVTAKRQKNHPQSLTHTVSSMGAGVIKDLELKNRELKEDVDVGGDDGVRQSLKDTATPTPPTNGKVGLTDAGEWLGVDEAQRLRWQAMFDTLSIPDTLRDAAVWLIAHPEERRVYTERGELAQYISRWLIREAKPDRTGRAKATADSQGKT